MAEPPEHLLFVDDDAALLRLLSAWFEQAGYGVECAPSGTEALKSLIRTRPDVVILDVMMPGLGGFETCRLIRRLRPEVPVVMLTARDQSADEIAGLRIGADDYVRKPFEFDVLEARIQAVLRRRRGLAHDRIVYKDLEIDVTAHVVRRGERTVVLTSTEFSLLLELTRHADQVLSKDQLLTSVWDFDFEGSVNVVEVYVASLRKKLEASGEPRLIETVRGAGYVLR